MRENGQEHEVFVFLSLPYMGDSFTPRIYRLWNKSLVAAVGPWLQVVGWRTLRDLPR